MITNHPIYAPFTLAAIAARTPYVRGYEIRWFDPTRRKYGSAMAEFLDLCDGEDESTGSAMDWHASYRRFGKRIVVNDSQGFVTEYRYTSEREAIEAFAATDLAYCQAMDEDEGEDEADEIIGATDPAVWCAIHEAPHAEGGFACELVTSESMTKSTLADVRALNANQLAYRADVTSPDSPDSPGAQLLASVRDSLVESIDQFVDEDGIVDEDEAHDLAHEIADSAPSPYTHAMWSQFLDLCAYGEDLDEYTSEDTSMEARARIAIYLIAERLALALVQEIADLDELGE